MGAAQSAKPRSVSMENPTPSSVIDISDEVVQRLRRGVNKQVKENASTSSATVAPVKEEKRVQPQKAAPAAPTPVRQPKTVYQNPPPLYWSGGATLTAMDIQRQKEAELLENDERWRQRLADLEASLKKTNVILENEFTSAAEDVRKRFANATASQQLPPCQDFKSQLIACYRAHPGETLRCAEEVANFRNCVNIHRIQKLEAEEVAAKAG